MRLGAVSLLILFTISLSIEVFAVNDTYNCSAIFDTTNESRSTQRQPLSPLDPYELTLQIHHYDKWGKLKESKLTSENWEKHANWAKGRTITASTENRSVEAFYGRHSMDISGGSIIATKPVNKSDVVLWTTSVLNHREHLYFQFFDSNGKLMMSSQLIRGEYDEVHLGGAVKTLQAMAETFNNTYPRHEIVLTITHTHPYDAPSGVSRKFSDDDLMAGLDLAKAARGFGLTIQNFEMYLLHGDDPKGGNFFYRETPGQFAKVGYNRKF